MPSDESTKMQHDTAGTWDPADRNIFFLAGHAEVDIMERELHKQFGYNHTAGDWNPDERNIYFLAANLSRQQWASVHHGYVLLAVNDLSNDEELATLDMMLDNGVKVLIDSGVFWLTNQHKRAHNLTMDQALALPPDRIDGFDWLWERYLAVMRRYGDRVWGYIELDQGGMTNKRITRAKLRDLGLSPIPVYHPLNDGWDYFDELAEEVDRICWGNVVQANGETRRRFLQTAWERHRSYPDLWIHLLGLTPNQWLNAYPVDSADSSTWLNVVRWDGYTERSMLRPLSKMPPNFKYVIGNTTDDNSANDKKALAMSALGMHCSERAWKHWQGRLRAELETDRYPDPTVGGMVR